MTTTPDTRPGEDPLAVLYAEHADCPNPRACMVVLSRVREAVAARPTVAPGDGDGLREAAQQALDVITLSAHEYAMRYGEAAMRSDDALVARLRAALDREAGDAS